jgi:hypothetical protein
MEAGLLDDRHRLVPVFVALFVAGLPRTSYPSLAHSARQVQQPPQGTSRTSGRTIVDSYILGPGDVVQVELLDVPEY